MSGMGENTSDPSRAESRKRKDPDQLGPRLDHLSLRMSKDKDLENMLNVHVFFMNLRK